MKLFADKVVWIDRDPTSADTEHAKKEATEQRLRKSAESFLQFVEQAIAPEPAQKVNKPVQEISYINKYSWLFKKKVSP